jgi:sarcosine oxidase, subunit gamma
MPDTRNPPARRTALGDDRGAAGGLDPHAYEAAAVQVLAPRARFWLRLDPSLLGQAGSLAPFQLDLPINRCQSAAGMRFLRLGPDEWLLLGPEVEGSLIAKEVEAALGHLHHALVDVSHAHVALSVSGPQAAEVINSGCPLDLSATAFPPGAATRTLLGKAEIILWRSEDRIFEIECGRSLAAYVKAFLDGARQACA